MRIVLAVLFVAACEPRGNIAYDFSPDVPGTVERIFVGSTRSFEPGEGGFGPGRDQNLRYASFDISVPPDHVPGAIEWPVGGRVDGARDFVTRREILYPDASDFRAAFRRELMAKPKSDREAVVFVHGYNNTFAEALYRLAQLRYDLDMPGVAVSYAWPSLAKPLGYAYDRDSVLFARDGLQKLLAELSDSGAERIILVAHSMGGLLTMETIRQIAISDDRRLMGRIGGVVLISPDIDVDVFRTQAERVRPLPQPFIVFTSRKDKILKLSARVSGDGERLGDIKNIGSLSNLKITFIDVSAFYGRADGGHFTVGNSPSLIRLLDKLQMVDGAMVSDRTARLGLVDSVVLTVQEATQIVLSPLTALTKSVQ